MQSKRERAREAQQSRNIRVAGLASRKPRVQIDRKDGTYWLTAAITPDLLASEGTHSDRSNREGYCSAAALATVTCHFISVSSPSKVA